MKKPHTLLLALVLAANWAAAADRTGSISIFNRDGSEHSLEIARTQHIIYVYPGATSDADAVNIPAGGTATTELAAGPWSVYGDGDYRFTVMINAGQDYDFTLQPFTQTGSYGHVSYGLLGLFDDGYNQSSYQLFTLPQAPPPIVVQPAPSMPPVVVVPSPSYYYPPPYPYRRDRGRDLGEAIGSAVFDILGEVLSDDHHHRRRRR